MMVSYGGFDKHIPNVPEDIVIEKKFLFEVNEETFTENMRTFFQLMKSMYKDMEIRPAEYGLLLIDIDQVNINKAEGNLAKAS